MEIKGMLFQYWAVLFSTCVGANMMGLNISDGFKTTVTIYIVIPFLIIPQIILSGIIVKFDNINPAISSPNKIPFYGEIMISRWAYEALAVYQFKNNEYERHFYGYDKEKSIAKYKKDFWLKTLENKIDYYNLNANNGKKKEKIKDNFELLRNELGKEISQNKKVSPSFKINKLYPNKIDKATLTALTKYFNDLRAYYNKRFNAASKLKDQLVLKMQKGKNGKDKFKKLMRQYSNKRLTEFVQNSDEISSLKEYKGHLYQKIDPIYNIPESSFLKAHFYAPSKKIFGKSINTIRINIIVIWLITLILYLTLHFRLLAKSLDFINYIKQNRQHKNKTEDK